MKHQVSNRIPIPASIALDRVTWVALSGVKSLNWNETVKYQNNRLLAVGVALHDYTTNVSNITYGGVPLTRIGSANCKENFCRSELWYLASPPSGTHMVIVGLSATMDVVGTSLTFYNVSQASPIATSASGGGWASTATVRLSTNPSQVVVDSFAGGGTYSFAPAVGQTQQWYDFTQEQGSGSTKRASAINTTMAWTTSSPDEWADVAAAINPAP